MTWMIWGKMTELLGKPPFQTYCRGNYNCFPFAVFTSNSNIYIYTLVSKHNGDIVLVSSDLMGPNVDNHKRVFMLNIMVIPSGHWTCLAGKSPTHLGTGNIIELNSSNFPASHVWFRGEVLQKWRQIQQTWLDGYWIRIIFFTKQWAIPQPSEIKEHKGSS